MKWYAIKSWIKNFLRIDSRVKKVDHNLDVMPWTIIKRGMSYKEFKTRYTTMHNFKYRFLIPLVSLTNWLFGKWILTPKDIAEEEQNKPILIFNEAFEYSIQLWCSLYRKEKVKDINNLYLRDPSIWMMRKLRDIVITFIKHDSAYKAWFDMLVVSVAVKMGEHYPGKIGIIPYRSVCIDDLDYRIISGKTNDNIVLNAGDHFLCFPKAAGFRIDTIVVAQALKEQEQRLAERLAREQALEKPIEVTK